MVQTLAADSKRLVEGLYVSQVGIEIETKPSSNAPAERIVTTKRIVSNEELARLEIEFKTNGLHQRISHVGTHGIFEPAGALRVHNFASDAWQIISEPRVLTSPPTSLVLNGRDAWLGGMGYIAVADLDQLRIRKFYRLPLDTSYRIELAAGSIWAQTGGRIYRIEP